MNVLVTGGAGYIGSHTVRALLHSGHHVVIYDNLKNGHKESLPTDVDLVEGCLSNTEKLDATFRGTSFDAVIHFAGYIEAGESMQDPLKFFENNVSHGINLIKVMLKHHVKKIVFSSSAGVYGNPETVPITEESKKKPVNYYGATKLRFETILDACKVYGMQSICLRYFNAAGAGHGLGEHHEPETHLIPLILEVALGKRDHIKIFGTDYPTKDGSCVRDYIHVLDLAEAHILSLEGLFQGKIGKYNLGSGEGYSVKEVIAMCREVTSHPIPVIETSRRAGDPATLVASREKFLATYHWKPELGLREIISSAWEWHTKNPEGYKKIKN